MRVALAVLLVLAAPARAEPSDTTRVIHGVTMLTMTGVYLTMEFPVNHWFAPTRCTWCEPPGFDRSVRDALVWENKGAAKITSDILGFGVAPAALGILMLSASGEHRTWRRTFDDAAPMIEAAFGVSLVQSATKYLLPRSRPSVRFAKPGRVYYHRDYVSFWSGHTSAVFAETFACGIVAHERGYKLEPAIWATGLSIGVITGYLRLAVDEHYLSDVVFGALIGTVFGIAVPYLFHGSSLERDPEATTMRTAPQFLSFGGQF